MTRTEHSRCRRPPRRGSALLLAVAVMVLLAVIGTAFIVIARTERGATRAMTDVINLDAARDALLGNVLGAMTAATTDMDGRPLTMAVPWSAGVSYAAGDIVYLMGGTDVPAGAAWCTYRCAANHVAQRSGIDGPPTVGGWWTTLSGPAYLTARRHDYPEVGDANGMVGGQGGGFVTVPTRDQPWLVQTGDTTRYSQLLRSRYSPAQGAYAAGQPAGPEVAVVDPTGPADGAYDILPFSTASGLRYRVSFRVEDESSRANLNVGNPDISVGEPQGQGRYLTSYQLYSPEHSPSLCKDGKNQARNIHSGWSANIWGRAPGTDMGLAWWQGVVLRYEAPRVAATDPAVAFFDLTDEMELRTYGVRGGGSIARPAVASGPSMMWSTLGAGAPTRQFFTANSFARDFTPLPPTHLGYTVGAEAALNYPRKICYNIPTPLTRAGATNAAMVASNLAAAMELCGYSGREARSLAVNYVAYKIGSGDSTAPSHGYWLPNGPSFIDSAGIKVRTRGGMADFTGPRDLKSEDASTAYVGLNAQPFVNEVVAYVDPKQGATPTDYAVELANPYPFDIDLAGTPGDPNSAWTLEIRDDQQKTLRVVSLAPAGRIEKSGFYVVTLGDTLLGEARGAKHSDPQMQLPAKGFVVLKRPAKLTENSRAFDAAVIVDVFGYDNPLYGSLPAEASSFSLQRDNTNPWMCAMDFYNSAGTGPSGTVEGTGGHHTLGLQNVVNAYYYEEGTNPAVVFKFYDRAPEAVDAYGAGDPLDANNSLFDLVDFNRIPRVTNIQLGRGVITLSSQLEYAKDRLNDPPEPLDLTYWESKVRFDFRGHPDPGRVADPRAAALFECLSPFDRFADTDYVHAEPDDPGGRYRTRIPGRINVNTAPVEVLKAIPTIGGVPRLAEEIVAYRERTGVFGNGEYPGVGIRSQAELFVPLAAVMALNGHSLEERDKAWGAVLVQTTVRSDSFVVYGLVEALRPAANHDNSDGQWYDPANGHQTVVARRRFLALVDRSFQNYAAWEGGSGVPRILAIKDLPE